MVQRYVVYSAVFLMLALGVGPNARAGVQPLKVYSIEQGLSQSVVQTMMQDSKGYLWFGTQDGLSRFDGLVFKNYDETGGLRQTSVLALHEDAEGSIWVGTVGGGAYRLRDGVFTQYTFGKSQESNIIHSIFSGDDGTIFVVDERGGVYRFTGDAFAMVALAGDEIPVRVMDALRDAEGTFWMATDGSGLLRLKDGEVERFGPGQGLSTYYLRSLSLDAEQRLWVGTDGEGVFRFDGARFTSVYTKEQVSGKIREIMPSPDGVIWFAGEKGAVRAFPDGHVEEIGKLDGMPVHAVASLLRDREGTMWFGTYGGGVVQFLTERFIHYTSLSGLSEGLVFAIAEDENGNMLFGTDGGGIYSLKDGKVGDPDMGAGVIGNTIYGIKRDRTGNLWFASYGDGVAVRMQRKWIQYTMDDGLISNSVFSMLEDSKGHMWFATENGVSVLRDGRFVNYTEGTDLPTGMILSVFEDSTGRIWFSTYSTGALQFINEHCTPLTEEDGLPSNQVYYIYEDREGRLWFGTSQGLAKLEQGKITTYTTADGLSNNRCYFIVQDDRGYLWIGTNKGLNRFDGEVFKHYTVKDGLITNEFNEGAVFKDSQGNLWFGCIEGVTKLFVDRDVPERVEPPIFIASVKVFDREVLGEAGARFGYNENYFKFEYEAPYFTAPSELHYEYKLEGLDIQWQSAKTRTVQYTSLKPGAYSFMVKAVTKDGLESGASAMYPFVIVAPFWSTLWFQILVALALIFLGVAAFRYKTKQIKKRNMMLERIVHERTCDLEQEKNKSDRLLSNILPHDLVEELKEKGTTTPRRFDSVSILFTDFKGFTNTSSTLPPENLVGELNDMFNAFDQIIEQHGLEKIKTIGDAYMIAGGLPRENKEHAATCIRAALAMLDYVAERNKNSVIKWAMRAGIHSGNVVAGVVGSMKFTYDVWGDTVNIASRMESASEPGRVNISAFTYYLVRDCVECEYRGKVDIKGKGEIDMYFVNGLKECVSSDEN